MDLGSKKRIAVLAGGYSGEAVISLQSAATVIENLDKNLFEPVLVRIDPESWWVVDEKNGNPLIDKRDFTFSNSEGKQISFDAIFLMVHGTPGEDGILQKYFEELNLPFTTGSSESVSGTFNKFKTTSKLRDAGFVVGASELSDVGHETIISNVGFPCFVKPNQGGSSLGISKINSLEELDPAIEAARNTGTDSIIVEALLEGREFSMGVVPGANNEAIAMPITEIITENEFFDYEAKYEGSSEEITPADISDAQRTIMQESGVKAYKLLGCRGMVRIDFILVDAEKPAILEVNTVPGFSKMSILPQQIEAAGISIKDMLTRVINS